MTRPAVRARPQELDAKVRALRDDVKKTRKEYDKTEDDLKALQSVGQIIGEVLRQLDAERCACPPAAAAAARAAALTRAASAWLARLAVIVKASSGPRYVVGCRTKLDKTKLVQGTRVALDMTTLTIMRALPREARALTAPAATRRRNPRATPRRATHRAARSAPRRSRARTAPQVDPVVYNMLHENPGQARSAAATLACSRRLALTRPCPPHSPLPSPGGLQHHRRPRRPDPRPARVY
jgi:hypothetical protein